MAVHATFPAATGLTTAAGFQTHHLQYSGAGLRCFACQSGAPASLQGHTDGFQMLRLTSRAYASSRRSSQQLHRSGTERPCGTQHLTAAMSEAGRPESPLVPVLPVSIGCLLVLRSAGAGPLVFDQDVRETFASDQIFAGSNGEDLLARGTA